MGGGKGYCAIGDDGGEVHDEDNEDGVDDEDDDDDDDDDVEEEEDVEEENRSQSGDIILCEPAQSKRAWTGHKSRFVRGHLQEKCRTRMRTPRLKPASTLTVRTPQCGHTVWELS